MKTPYPYIAAFLLLAPATSHAGLACVVNHNGNYVWIDWGNNQFWAEMDLEGGG